MGSRHPPGLRPHGLVGAATANSFTFLPVVDHNVNRAAGARTLSPGSADRARELHKLKADAHLRVPESDQPGRRGD